MFFFQMPELPELFMKAKDFDVLKLMTAANATDYPAYKHVFSQPGKVSIFVWLSNLSNNWTPSM